MVRGILFEEVRGEQRLEGGEGAKRISGGRELQAEA